MVLVLGAGSSKPYGLPLAGELFNLAVEGRDGLVESLANLGFSKPHTEEFIRALHLSQLPSIDSFLEYRREFMEVGKATIAFYLIARESEPSLIRTNNEGHWYQFLYHRMKVLAFDEFAENKLSVITFNYDRSLEHFLTQALIATHNKPLQDVKAMLAKIPIIHVHGKLGDLTGHERSSRPYNTAVSPESLQTAIAGIRVASEDAMDDPVFQQAHDVLGSAEVLLFLGFGFHPENVVRLQLHTHLADKALVSGSVVGKTTSEFDKSVRPLFSAIPDGQFGLRNNSQRVLEFLRNNLDLLMK